MKRCFVVAAAVLLAACSFYACRSTKKEAADYNNRIVDLQSQIVRSMIGFSNALDSKDKPLMDKKLKELEVKVAATLKQARAMEPFNGSGEFRDGAIKLFNFYDAITRKEYRETVDIYKKEDITQEDVERITKINEDLRRREEILDAGFKKIQEAFAKKYNIALVKNELQGEVDKR